MNTNVFGYHLIINAKNCDKVAVTSSGKIAEFSSTLVSAIDMTPYGDPQIVHFAAHNPDAGGYTLIQLIETSNISGHFVDASGNAFVDIFSCKTFDPNVAVKVFVDCFNPERIDYQFIVREV